MPIVGGFLILVAGLPRKQQLGRLSNPEINHSM
jgi:hypothetical protein